jgi:hypothetical protein
LSEIRIWFGNGYDALLPRCDPAQLLPDAVYLKEALLILI